MTHRTVATDCLVAIGGSRDSVSARYVGESIVVRELLGSYEILHEGTVIGRHQVVLEPAHYAGLLHPRGIARVATGPPRYDPGYPGTADVTVRDLGAYAAIAEEVV